MEKPAVMTRKLKGVIMRRPVAILMLIAAMILGPVPGLKAEASKMVLTSPAFEEGRMIPVPHTCEGKNISPSLRWTDPPSGTQSFALIVEDPDAPGGLWVHWVLFNIPPTLRDLPQGLPDIHNLANTERHGTNDFHKRGYNGPCPPAGTHRYYFHLYALDIAPRLEASTTRSALLKTMEGHMLAEAQLMGKYRRKK